MAVVIEVSGNMKSTLDLLNSFLRILPSYDLRIMLVKSKSKDAEDKTSTTVYMPNEKSAKVVASWMFTNRPDGVSRVAAYSRENGGERMLINFAPGVGTDAKVVTEKELLEQLKAAQG